MAASEQLLMYHFVLPYIGGVDPGPWSEVGVATVVAPSLQSEE